MVGVVLVEAEGSSWWRYLDFAFGISSGSPLVITEDILLESTIKYIKLHNQQHVKAVGRGVLLDEVTSYFSCPPGGDGGVLLIEVEGFSWWGSPPG